MATDKKEVSASSDSAESVAAAVSADQTPPAKGEPEKAPEPTAAGITLDDLTSAVRGELNSYQGKQNNYTAAQFKRIEDNLNARLDSALAPIASMETARVAEMEPEQKAAYWEAKANAPAPEPVAPAPVADNVGGGFSDADRLRIINTTTTMLNTAGVNVPYTDDRLWVGATNDMTPDQIIEIGRQNAQKLRPAPTPAPAVTQETPNGVTPTSTQAAPSSTSVTYGSRTEANEALLRGDIKNIDELQTIGLAEGWYKPRN